MARSPRICVTLPQDLHDRMQAYVDGYGGNISDLMRRAAMERVIAWEERQAKNASQAS